MSASPNPDSTPATDTGNDKPARRGHFLNWLTIVGLIGIAFAFTTGVILLVVEVFTENHSPYLSLLTFGVVPVLIIGGFGLVIMGVVIQTVAMSRRGEPLQFLVLDPHKNRRRWPIWLGALLFFVIVSAYGTHESYAWVESKQFCGEVCHDVMHPEFEAHANSPHARVACVECHVGSGIDHKIKAKLRGLNQVKGVVTGEYPVPLHASLSKMRPANEICEQCHWPEKAVGETVQDHVYYLPNEENSPFHLKLMLPVDGGVESEPSTDHDHAHKHPSIHWHVNSPNRIHFVATDEKNQDIQWVKLVGQDGQELTYRREDSELSEADLLSQYESRVMDCMDCHNRAVHVFKPPQRLLNQAMLAGSIDPSLPYVKREGLRLLAAEYASREAARTAITQELKDFYAAEYPDLATEKQAAIESAGQAIGELYSANIFPEMKADWRAHPSNIGHMFSKGCFRCHDGQMKDARGVAISSSCNTCHSIVAQGEGHRATGLEGPVEFVHPEFIDELWRDSPCTDCHDGAGGEL